MAVGDTGLLEVEELNDLDILVDKQVARFIAYTSILKHLGDLRGLGEELMKSLVQRVWRDAASWANVFPWRLAKAI